jgi:hypothetical protein
LDTTWVYNCETENLLRDENNESWLRINMGPVGARKNNHRKIVKFFNYATCVSLSMWLRLDPCTQSAQKFEVVVRKHIILNAKSANLVALNKPEVQVDLCIIFF